MESKPVDDFITVRGVEQPHILLHHHIFKNAGTTIDSVLRRNFPNSFFQLEPERDLQVVPPEELLNFLNQHPDARAVSSHNFRFPSPAHPTFRFVEISFVRHPLDRLQSMYYFYRGMATSDFRAVPAKTMSLPDFLLWFLENQPFNVINSQTVIFSKGWAGDGFYPPSWSQLREAVDRMRAIKFLGVVERTDESMTAAEFFLRPFFPHLDLSYVAQNARVGRSPSLSERLEEMRSLCGEHVFNWLQDLNRLDLELWASANRELDRRLKFMSNIQDKLCNFGSRCQIHGNRNTVRGAILLVGAGDRSLG